MNWFVQALLDSAGFVASYFITRDAPQFGLLQGAVALVLLVSIVGVLACAMDHFFQLGSQIKRTPTSR